MERRFRELETPSDKERKKIEEVTQHLGKLDKYYPVEGGTPAFFQIRTDEFERYGIIRLLNVGACIPLVVDTLGMCLVSELFKIIKDETTSWESVEILTPIFEDAKEWIQFVDDVNVKCSFVIPNDVIVWVDALNEFNQRRKKCSGTQFIFKGISPVVTEIIECSCPMSIREHLVMIIQTMAEMLSNVYKLKGMSSVDAHNALDDIIKKYERLS